MSRRTAPWLVVGVIVVAAVSVVVADSLSSPGRGRSTIVDNAYPTSLASITKRSLSAQTDVAGTLGYAGSFSAVNQSQGTFTWLPTVGTVISQLGVLYRVDGEPVVLLYGSIPAYRSLSSGMTGADVQQFNADLVAAGEATPSQLSPTSDYFGTATIIALEKLQAALGVTENGVLSLGQAVFLPSAMKVTTVTPQLGSPAQLGQPVIQGTSTTRQVSIALDVNLAADVRVGDIVSITLPDGSSTPGVVTSVGSVATSPPSTGGPSGGSGNSTPTVTVDVAPSDPAATGKLDQTPVQVAITTASVTDSLVVPIDALLAQSPGGYAVEVVNPDGTHHLVDVHPGLFDEADNLVQVSGAGLSAGQRVVVPSI